jgi:hypothetical protein
MAVHTWVWWSLVLNRLKLQLSIDIYMHTPRITAPTHLSKAPVGRGWGKGCGLQFPLLLLLLLLLLLSIAIVRGGGGG